MRLSSSLKLPPRRAHELTRRLFPARSDAAEKAFETVWGEHTPGSERGRMLMKLADLFEEHADTLASIEALDNGKAFGIAKGFDVMAAAGCLRFYGGLAGKNDGKTIEVNESKFAFTRQEPIGVVGQIIPWNFPILMFAWKISPALAAGCTIVMKVAETTPLSAFYACQLIAKVFPPGVVNVLTGYGNVVGAAISSHMRIMKVAFTGSTLVGRQIMKAAAMSNLKPVTLELGGKSPNVVFDDADLDQAASWGAFGLFFNACVPLSLFARAAHPFSPPRSGRAARLPRPPLALVALVAQSLTHSLYLLLQWSVLLRRLAHLHPGVDLRPVPREAHGQDQVDQGRRSVRGRLVPGPAHVQAPVRPRLGAHPGRQGRGRDGPPRRRAPRHRGLLHPADHLHRRPAVDEDRAGGDLRRASSFLAQYPQGRASSAGATFSS